MSAELTVLTLHERDITSEVCQRCARCCQVEIKLPGADSRYRQFLRRIGFEIVPAVEAGKDDCCAVVHDATLVLGPCAHLRASVDERGRRFACALFGDARRPQLCEHYNCVSWAKTSNRYHLDNEILRAAQRAFLEVAANTDARGVA